VLQRYSFFSNFPLEGLFFVSLCAFFLKNNYFTRFHGIKNTFIGGLRRVAAGCGGDPRNFLGQVQIFCKFAARKRK